MWNEAIAKPFRDALGENARGCVPIMVQGLAECREILVDANDPKKGSWHFTTAYLGSGVDYTGGRDFCERNKRRWEPRERSRDGTNDLALK